MGSGASSTVAAREQQRQQAALQSEVRQALIADPRRGGGAVQQRRTSYWCHQCQVSVNRLADGGVCPLCHQGFIQESSSVVMVAQAARWLASGSGPGASTETRIARLLDDLHAHLEMVEGLHESMRVAMDAAEENGGRPKVDPAPQVVLDAIKVLDLDAEAMDSMQHQTPQCVICCADFEVSERLSQLPGCGHFFHEGCVMQWLERASNCPICRGDLAEAVGLTSSAGSAAAGEAGLEEASVTAPAEVQTRRSQPASRPAPSSSPDQANNASTGGARPYLHQMAPGSVAAASSERESAISTAAEQREGR